MSTHQPFTNDFEHLEVFAKVMAARARKLLAQKELRQQAGQYHGGDAPPVGRRKNLSPDDAESRFQMWAAREERIQGELEGRLDAHRRSTKVAPLRIDQACLQHDFGANERLVVLAVTLPAVWSELAEETFEGLNLGFRGQLGVETLLTLLEAGTIEERVRLRGLFSPTGKLLVSGLVDLEFPGKKPVPEDLLALEVRLTHEGFTAVLGISEQTPKPVGTFIPDDPHE